MPLSQQTWLRFVVVIAAAACAIAWFGTERAINGRPVHQEPTGSVVLMTVGRPPPDTELDEVLLEVEGQDSEGELPALSEEATATIAELRELESVARESYTNCVGPLDEARRSERTKVIEQLVEEYDEQLLQLFGQ